MSFELFKKYGYSSVYTLDAALHGGVASRIGFSGMDIDADGAPRAYAPPGSNLKGLDILADGMDGKKWVGGPSGPDGRPIIQKSPDPAPGFYVSSTSWKAPGVNGQTQRAYVAADIVPFWVVPGVEHDASGQPIEEPAAKMGALGIAFRPARGLYAPLVCADVGPRTHYGEGSIRLAQMLSVPSSPIDGGISSGIYTILFYEAFLDWGDWGNIQSKANALFASWGGDAKLKQVIQTIFG